MHRVVQRAAAQLIDPPSQQPLGGGIHVADVAGVIERAERLAHAVGDGTQVFAGLAERLRRLDALGGIDGDAGHSGWRSLGVVIQGAGDVADEPRPVLALQLALGNSSTRPLQRLEACLGDRAMLRSNDDFGYVTAYDLDCRPAVDLLRAAVPQFDRAVQVAADHGGVEPLEQVGAQLCGTLRLDEGGAVVVLDDDPARPVADKTALRGSSG